MIWTGSTSVSRGKIVAKEQSFSCICDIISAQKIQKDCFQLISTISEEKSIGRQMSISVR